VALSVVSEEIATENAENCRRRQPRCRLTPPSRGTPVIIRTCIPYIPQTRITSFKFFWRAR